MASKQATALVLVDVPRHGLRVGQIVKAPAQIVHAMHQAGEVDPEPAAVKHADDAGAPTVTVQPDAK